MENFETIYAPEIVIELGIEELGSRTQLAAHLEISASTLDKWKQTGIVPGKHACALAELTGLGPWQISPDVFDPKYAVRQREMTLIKLLRDAQSRNPDEDILGDYISQASLL